MFKDIRRFITERPLPWVMLIYVIGVAIRAHYTLSVHKPQQYIYSDMEVYVSLAKRIANNGAPLARWDITHPLGYPLLMSRLYRWDESLALAAWVHFVVGALVPLVVGLLGAAAFGRMTAFVAIVFASLYFPYIEFGGFFLSEIHFIFWLTLSFAGLFSAARARSTISTVVLSLLTGASLSIAAALKSVALPAAASFFTLEALRALFFAENGRERVAGLRAAIVRGALTAAATLPVLGSLARVCTQANQGKFCVTGNKIGADFLLGHYGRIAGIQWGADEGRAFRFGSPGAYLRHYDAVPTVPFPITDSAANSAEAWKWISNHPFDAFVVSLDHIYDLFFGTAIWPTYATVSWRYGHLSQYAFVLLLFVPAVLMVSDLVRGGGLRRLVTNPVALLFAPLLALSFTVFVATGEVRYRIPFDVFFIVAACAYLVGDVMRKPEDTTT